MEQSNAAEHHPDIFLKTVEVDVSDEEYTARLERLAAVDNSINDTEATKASRMSDFNAELKQLRKERGKLLDAIRSRREKQDVECYQVADERRGIMATIRKSDGAVIDERALTLEERQGKFPFEENREGMKARDEEGGGDEREPRDTEAPPGFGDEGDEAPAKPKAGKVVRLKASDVKKRKAARSGQDE